MGGSRRESELRALEASVQVEYPDLRLVAAEGGGLLRGSFPIRHEGEELDRFLIEISFPDGPNRLPAIKEIGGRIPRTIDRHVNPSGELCIEVPEMVLARGAYDLLKYLNTEVRTFFIGQHLVEHGEQWPFGEWGHGRKGLLEAYGSLLGVADEDQIRAFLDCLGHKKIKGHWRCPCRSGRVIRDCHEREIRRLHTQVSPTVARRALQRLDTGK